MPAKMRDKSAEFTDYDSYLFHEGTNYEAYRKLGAHPDMEEGVEGTRFNVWAPHAEYVSLITSATGWENEKWMHRCIWDHGVWECFLPGVGPGDAYRYVVTGTDGLRRYKSDPFAFRSERNPGNASIICTLDTYSWNDAQYQTQCNNTSVLDKPMTIYEVHLGSWKKRYRSEDDLDGFLNYRELADELSVYLNNLGFTYVELIGIAEYPYDPSWGYQVTGYYAPTSRYGLPDDLRYFIDVMHAAGIGVIMDWVPAHFPKDAYGLEYFDGTTLYENSDPILREFSSWGTHAFDHSKPEVRSFLISNALYWIREFHFDALRVDAVAAMIHYNQDRIVWKPNKYGGVHNLESMDFLRQLNREVCARTAGYLIAEDATIEPRITEDVAKGGLGFTFKWNLGWMYDTLIYYGYDAEKAVCCHNELTHVADYAFLENYVLSLSHDEVSHFKGSLVSKSLGSPDERRSKLKALYTFQYTFPGKKLLFMGQEFATDKEWNVLESLDWDEMQEAPHREVMQCLIQLIRIYKKYPCLYMDSKDPSTFEWINREDSERSVISYIRRRPGKYAGALLVVINFSACGYEDYSFGTPFKNKNKLIFSSSGNPSGNEGFASFDSATHIKAAKKECDGHPYMLSYNLRPFEAVIIEEDPQESQG